MDAKTLSTIMDNRLSLTRYQELVEPINQALLEAGCTTVNRVAMFCAQICAESGGLTWTEELADGSAYEWRADLGNVYAGDGKRYKGRSFIQITGRHNYTALSAWAHSKGYVSTATYFVDNPTQLAADKYAFLGPVWYWTVARPQMNRLADNKDIYGATLAVNGGTNNLTGRTAYWKVALAQGNAILPVEPYVPPKFPLKAGQFFGVNGRNGKFSKVRRQNIRMIQARLNKYNKNNIATTGHFNTMTAKAVNEWKKTKKGYPLNGKIGRPAWNELFKNK